MIFFVLRGKYFLNQRVDCNKRFSRFSSDIYIYMCIVCIPTQRKRTKGQYFRWTLHTQSALHVIFLGFHSERVKLNKFLTKNVAFFTIPFGALCACISYSFSPFTWLDLFLRMLGANHLFFWHLPRIIDGRSIYEMFARAGQFVCSEWYVRNVQNAWTYR